MKNKIVKIIFSFIISFSFISYVKAEGIYDYIKNGDIIIGNTTFRNGTWISATRASKAGALYTKNNSSTNVKTYKFITKGLWYELDENGKYSSPLDSNSITEIENNLKIFYENNSPINLKYSKLEDENGNPTDLSYLLNLYTSNDTSFVINDSNIIFDIDNNSVTCPYDYEFEFSLVPIISSDVNTKYVGHCIKDDIFFEEKEKHDMTDLEIQDVNIANVNYSNQSKISLKDKYFNMNYNYVINSELDAFEISEDDFNLESGKYIILDVFFDENNNVNNYNILNVESDSTSGIKIINNNTIRLYIPVVDAILNGNHFMIIDSYHHNYQDLYIKIDARLENILDYEWDTDKDTAGKQKLYIVNKNGEKISGYATIKYKDTSYEDRIYIPNTGKLLVSDVIENITNISKEE